MRMKSLFPIFALALLAVPVQAAIPSHHSKRHHSTAHHKSGASHQGTLHHATTHHHGNSAK